MAGNIPGVFYNRVSRRLELRGQGGAVKQILPDDQTPMAGIYLRVATSSAVDVGTLAIGVATLAVDGLGATDKLFANPKAALVLPISGIRVLADGIALVDLHNHLSRLVSQPAAGWDVIYFKTT